MKKSILILSAVVITATILTSFELYEEGTNSSSNSSSINSVKIGNLEVMTKDLGVMNWEDAKKACANLGDGWRLPTQDELNVLYINKEKIGGFTNSFYWSSEGSDYAAKASGVNFYNGDKGYGFKANTGSVRAVYEEGTNSGSNSSSSNSSSVNFVKIGNLEVMTKDLGVMNWEDAKRVCANLGDGWRLPRKDELDVLYINKEKIGGFENYVYWSSTEYSATFAFAFDFRNGNSNYYGFKTLDCSVRAVRAF